MKPVKQSSQRVYQRSYYQPNTNTHTHLPLLKHSRLLLSDNVVLPKKPRGRPPKNKVQDQSEGAPEIRRTQRTQCTHTYRTLSQMNTHAKPWADILSLPPMKMMMMRPPRSVPRKVCQRSYYQPNTNTHTQTCLSHTCSPLSLRR